MNSFVTDNQEITNQEDIVVDLDKHFDNIAEKTFKESEREYCRVEEFLSILVT